MADKKDVTDLTERNKLFSELKNSEKKFANIIEQNTKAWKNREEKMYQRGKGGEPSNDIFTGFYKWAAKKQPGIYEEATRRAYKKAGYLNTAVFAKEVRKLTAENAMKGPLGAITRLYTQNRFAKAIGSDFGERLGKTPLGKGMNSILGVFRGKKEEEKEMDPAEQSALESATSLKEINRELVNANYANMFVIKSHDSLISIQKDVESIKNFLLRETVKAQELMVYPLQMLLENSKEQLLLSNKAQELMVYPLDMLLENSKEQLSLSNKVQELMVYPLDQMLENSNKQLTLTNGSDIANNVALRNSEERGDLLLEAVLVSGEGIQKALGNIKGGEGKKGGFLSGIMDLFKSLGPLLSGLLAPLISMLAPVGAALIGLLPKLLAAAGPAAAVLAAGAIGFAIGNFLDKKFGLSDKLSRAIGGNEEDRNKEMAAQNREGKATGILASRKTIADIQAMGGTTEEKIAELEKRRQMATDAGRDRIKQGSKTDKDSIFIDAKIKESQELQKEINKLKGAQIEKAPGTEGAEMTALAADNANQQAAAVVPVSMQGGNSSSSNTSNVTTVVQSKSLNRSDLAAYGRMQGAHAW